MRTLAVAMATALAALGVASSATAAPVYSLIWTGTTGTGTTGGTSIAAVTGDILTLDNIVTIDPMGFTSASFDMLGTSNLIAASNTLLGLGGPPECPDPPNLAPGVCFSATFLVFTPTSVGVVDSGSDTLNYDVAGPTPEFTPSTMTIGRAVFVVMSSPIESVSLGFGGAPGGGRLTDGSGVQTFSNATATVIVPEPRTAALMGLGLLALSRLSRRRR